MRPRILLFLAILTTLLLGGHAPSPIQNDTFQHDLDALTKRGFTYRMLDNDLIELTDPLSCEKRLKSLREPSETQIRAWAAQRGIPILEIDPTTVETTKFAGWYLWWGQVPVGNGFGHPIVVDDLDRNRFAELYATYRLGSFFKSRIYQIDSIGNYAHVLNYDSLLALPRLATNVDSDSLKEIFFSNGGDRYDYEQLSLTGLPVRMNFVHNAHQGNLDPGFTGIFIGSLDDDSLTDFLYKGSECDSVDTTDCITKVYIAEYNQQANNFVRVWSTDYDLSGNVAGVGGFAVDDFDGDGKQEFAAVELATHRVFVVENTGDNSFVWTWQDSTPFVNLYFTTSGDVDHDGKPDFFVGATSNGSWTTMYEADSNNHYSAKFIIHLLSGGLFDEPTYLTTDVDGDGILELVIMSGNDLYIFKSREDNAYHLWYLKREDTKDAVAFYDFNHDGRKDFIISKYGLDSLGRPVYYADYYRATSLVSVREDSGLPSIKTLSQNYPNPFNPSTTVRYVLSKQELVTLKVYNILGQEMATLVDARENPGEHTVAWNANNLASGVYFCRLSTRNQVFTIKLLLIR